ncbi:MAG: AAA family ATPase [Syntrophomonadaceae bacterium]|nr:AAA family ATPase [Syntrophomonadaceae bacterium]MDD3023411.1 AAA family ATPase [Syntrophomonadaceae bacterium]
MHLKRIDIRSDNFPVNDVYPFNLEVLQKTASLSFTSPVTFLIGENGCGKSTLLRAIATKCGIHIWRDTERRQYQVNRYADRLYQCIEPEWEQSPVNGAFFESEMFHHFAEMVDDSARATPEYLKYYGGEPLKAKSHGQYHMAYFRNRYRIKGLYLMDEPENALSPRRQLELLGLLKELSMGGHAQFIIASHSPILLALPGAVLYSLDQAPISPTTYENTQYYQLYRDFLNNRERYI